MERIDKYDHYFCPICSDRIIADAKVAGQATVDVAPDCCLGCLNLLRPDTIDFLAQWTENYITKESSCISASPASRIVFEVHFPPLFDFLLSIVSLTAQIRADWIESMMNKLLEQRLGRTKQATESHIIYRLHVSVSIPSQRELCLAIFPGLLLPTKKRKRRWGCGAGALPFNNLEDKTENYSSLPEDSNDGDSELPGSGGDDEELNKDFVNSLLYRLKEAESSAEPTRLFSTLISLLTMHPQPLLLPARCVLTPATSIKYLLGRYTKHARDVPQSAWTVSGGQRKGRGSVEELIISEVRATLGALRCGMHACGREDIDVRCLGRCPFTSVHFNVQVSILIHVCLSQGMVDHLLWRWSYPLTGQASVRACWEG
jgi:hypothetical protein